MGGRSVGRSKRARMLKPHFGDVIHAGRYAGNLSFALPNTAPAEDGPFDNSTAVHTDDRQG